MITMSIKAENEIDYLLKLVELQGIACATVSDGHIILIKREKLLAILEQTKDKDTVSLFIKRPELQG